MLHPTTIAGRHTADRERERAARAAAEAKQLTDDAARDALHRAIAARGIRVLDVLDDGRHTLSIRCGIETCAQDGELVEAIVTDHGFRLDPARLSRFRDRFEHLRLRQEGTGAQLELLISRPGALHRTPLEAA